MNVTCLAKERQWRATISPESRARGGDLLLTKADFDPASGEAGIERVVVGIEAQIRLLRDADHASDRARR